MQHNDWQHIYKQQSPKLLGICRRYINDLATAEDIVQDSFMVAIEKENSLKNSELLNGWLSRIVINNALNHLKNEKKINYANTENYEIIDETTVTNTSELDKKSAVLAHDFSQDDLLKAIDSLSENHKSVFNLYIIDKFSHLEISKLLNISVGTSKSSLSRARKNVQEFLINKLTANKPNEKKNRKIAFLIFLGMGDRLFANQFRKSFANFEIQPKNNLNLSQTIKNPNASFAVLEVSKSLVLQAIKIAVAVASVSVLGIYLTNKNEKVIVDKKPIVKTEIVAAANDTTTASAAIIKFDENIKEKIEIAENKIVVNNSKSEPKPTIVNAQQNIMKDTISQQQAPPKVVVIKRQIIKRDTSYVQK